jgi:hypothetical protein
MSDASDAVATLVDAEQRVAPTDPEQLNRALDGDPDAIAAVRCQREAVEHLTEARRLLRAASDATESNGDK